MDSVPACCVECSKPVDRKVWKISQSQALQPRLLHDIDSMVVLISCQYVCPNNHHYLTTDPRILEVMKSEDIPFVLLHKSGFVKSFVHRVIGLISEGMTIAAVERFITEQRRLFIAATASQVKSKLSLSSISCTTQKTLENPYPSNDILYKCFITDFLINSQRYSTHMAQIVAKDTISFDHTCFEYRLSQGRWNVGQSI